MTTVHDLCVLVSHCVAWVDDEPRADITPDTELLAMGLLDSLTIRRIVAELADTCGVSIPDAKIVAATFRTPAALWAVVTELREAA